MRALTSNGISRAISERRVQEGSRLRHTGERGGSGGETMKIGVGERRRVLSIPVPLSYTSVHLIHAASS